jgi:hypothetical protein
VVKGVPMACGADEGEGESGAMLATMELMKIFKSIVALPAKLPQKNWRVRGPGGERNATMTMVAKPSLSVTTGELLDANAIEMVFDAVVMRSTTLEATPLVVNTNDAAASYREESVAKGGKQMRKRDNAAARNSSTKTQGTEPAEPSPRTYVWPTGENGESTVKDEVENASETIISWF